MKTKLHSSISILHSPFAFLAVLTLFATAPRASAQSVWNPMNMAMPEAKLTASDGAFLDSFGRSVSLSENGTTALVGAYEDDTPGGQDAGSAYVFVRSGSSWSQQAKLTAADGAAEDSFGSSLSLSGDGNTALVGAYQADTPVGTNAGSAYVFVRNGSSWSQQAKLTAADAAEGDFFGIAALSSNGNTALVGAYGAGSEAGSAYVFVRSGSSWSQQAKLTAGDAAAGDLFGSSVSLSGDGNTALVGAGRNDPPRGQDAGGAYVFVRNGNSWSQQAKLTAADGAAGDLFGCSVSLKEDGSAALVGACFDPELTEAHFGSAYVFVRGGSSWSQQAKLTVGDAAAGDLFGYSVSLRGDGNAALVGAFAQDTLAGVDAGSAYVFVRSGNTWSQRDKLTADDGAEGNLFGISVCLSGDGNTALVGALLAGELAGSAYVFRLLTVPESYNRLAAEVLAGGAVRLSYLGLAGTNYALDRTFNLAPPVVWVPQATNPAPPGGILILTNTPVVSTNNFWRMRFVP